MKINKRTKMAHSFQIEKALKYSDTDIIEEVRKFPMPKKIRGLKVTPDNKVSIGNMMKIWDIKTDENLTDVTISIFLKNTARKRFLASLTAFRLSWLPFIDFMRLCVNTGDLGDKAAKLFDSLKREPKDEKRRAIFAKYKGNQFDFIKRFCDIAPAYTYDEAYNVPWVTVFMAFQAKVQQDDIEQEIMELEKNNLKAKK